MGGDGTWRGERKRAEPEGGQYCDSRWKFLFEETVFSAAQLIMCLSVCDIFLKKLGFLSGTFRSTCMKSHQCSCVYEQFGFMEGESRATLQCCCCSFPGFLASV